MEKTVDIVTIVCYNKTKKMPRHEAIKEFGEGMLVCEGSEAERYAQIYEQLLAGYKVCSDKIN